MAELLVYKGGVVAATSIVDDEDLERLSEHRWALHPRGYVKTFVQGVGRQGRGVKGPGHYETLHRMVCGLRRGDGVVVDHINGDKFDNRKANLATGTQTDNQQNRAYGYGRSRFRGVGWDGSRGKWIASAKLPGMRASKFLGRFATEEEAAQVSANFRAEHMACSAEARSRGLNTQSRPG